MEEKYKFRYNIGDTIETFGRSLTIVDREIRDFNFKKKNGKPFVAHRRYYKYHCNKCGNEDWMEQSALSTTGTKCNVCAHNKVLKGYNDIATTSPWMVDLLKDKNDAFKYSNNSTAKLTFVCPNCGKERIMMPTVVYREKHIPCVCGDSWSYPNKFMYSVLTQLGVNFEYEKLFPWSDNRKYDNYIKYNDISIITEQHGLQHYEDIPSFERTLKEDQENDRYKRFMAGENGIDFYFEINCSKSEKNFVKCNILSSGLFEVLDCKETDVNWDECEKFALSNTCKMICDFKCEHPELTLKQIAKELNLHYRMVLRNVQKGSKVGWCEYTPCEDKAKNIKYNNFTSKCKPIHCITTGEYFFDSKTAAEYMTTLETYFYWKNLKRSILDHYEYKGHWFEYVTQEQFNKVKSESPDIVHGDYFNINFANT